MGAAIADRFVERKKVPGLAWVAAVALVLGGCGARSGLFEVASRADAGTESSVVGDAAASDVHRDDAPPEAGGDVVLDVALGSGGPCAPGATHCLGNRLETCGPSGEWGSAVPCPAATPSCSAGVCGDPLSCQAMGTGTPGCGPTNESCCASVEIPGGTFYRTYHTNAYGDPLGLADPATVSDFRLDKYPVTVARFRQYVNYLVGGGSPPADGSGKHAYLNGGLGLANADTDGGIPYETGWDATDWNAFIVTGSGGANT